METPVLQRSPRNSFWKRFKLATVMYVIMLSLDYDWSLSCLQVQFPPPVKDQSPSVPCWHCFPGGFRKIIPQWDTVQPSHQELGTRSIWNLLHHEDLTKIHGIRKGERVYRCESTGNGSGVFRSVSCYLCHIRYRNCPVCPYIHSLANVSSKNSHPRPVRRQRGTKRHMACPRDRKSVV